VIAEPILVTGATGFLGQHLCRELRQRGLAVRAMVRPGRDASPLEADGAAIIRGDLSDPSQVRQAVQGCATVFHLAAARGPLKLSRRGYLELNPGQAELVGKACLAVSLRRLVFTSTARIGYRDDGEPSDERCHPRAGSGYRESKLKAEETLLGLGPRGLDVVIARLPQIMGPGAIDWRRDFLKVWSGRMRYLPTGGMTHIVDVDDVIQGLCRCAEVSNVAGERFILAAANPVTVRDLYSAIADAVGVTLSVRTLPGGPFRAYARAASLIYRAFGVAPPFGFTAERLAGRASFGIDKARTMLGFSPQWDMPATVARTARWMREMGWFHG
jgi:dihydroflavonol-4-reductase